MKAKLVFLSSVVAFSFSGCVVDIAELQQKETFNSKIIKELVTDENSTTAGTTSLLNQKKKYQDTSPLLAPPKISKMTINGYIDTDGDYHEKEIIHLKVEDGKFVENKKYFSINTKEQ